MIIIVEGIDRVGKTTLCNIFKEDGAKVFHDEYKADYMKIENPTKEQKKEFNKIIDMKFNLMLQFLKLYADIPDLIVIDRFHFSEEVYNYFRNLNFNSFFSVDEILASMNPILILVESVDINKSSKEHGSDLSEHEKLFNELFKITKIKRKVKINYKDIQKFKEAKEILDIF